MSAIEESSNGKTPDSDSGYLGSNPSSSKLKIKLGDLITFRNTFLLPGVAQSEELGMIVGMRKRKRPGSRSFEVVYTVGWFGGEGPPTTEETYMVPKYRQYYLDLIKRSGTLNK